LICESAGSGVDEWRQVRAALPRLLFITCDAARTAFLSAIEVGATFSKDDFSSCFFSSFSIFMMCVCCVAANCCNFCLILNFFLCADCLPALGRLNVRPGNARRAAMASRRPESLFAMDAVP
jgi:hypothetical protein